MLQAARVVQMPTCSSHLSFFFSLTSTTTSSPNGVQFWERKFALRSGNHPALILGAAEEEITNKSSCYTHRFYFSFEHKCYTLESFVAGHLHASRRCGEGEDNKHCCHNVFFHFIVAKPNDRRRFSITQLSDRWTNVYKYCIFPLLPLCGWTYKPKMPISSFIFTLNTLIKYFNYFKIMEIF